MKTLYTIVGMQHQPGAREKLATLRTGDPVVLERDPFNEYDSNAVKVLVAGFHVGFIKGSEVKPLADAIDRRGANRFLARYAVDGSRWPQVEVETP